MAEIAVIGPGAIGCTMLGWLGQIPGHRLTVGARTPFRRVELETPEGPLVVEPAVLTSPASARPVDWVLIATKAYDAAGAAQWLGGLAGDRTRVAILQNGVEHLERFAAHVPAERLLPVVIDCPAERRAPGRVRQRGPVLMTVPATETGRRFAALFGGTPVRVALTDDWKSAAWRKLCLNAAGAVSALTLLPARVAQDARVADVMRGIVREALAVGRAEGAQLDESLVESVLAGYRQAPPDSLNSLHADRLAGRPMEADARNGVIVRLGRKHGIDTPYNETLFALLEALQPGAVTGTAASSPS
jgi:2-dehydropantoate 2-reductase